MAQTWSHFRAFALSSLGYLPDSLPHFTQPSRSSPSSAFSPTALSSPSTYFTIFSSSLSGILCLNPYMHLLCLDYELCSHNTITFVQICIPLLFSNCYIINIFTYCKFVQVIHSFTLFHFLLLRYQNTSSIFKTNGSLQRAY